MRNDSGKRHRGEDVGSVADTIFTIGYGDRTMFEVFRLLLENRVDCLVDVRSRPFSGFKPEFSRDSLQNACLAHDVRYEFLGDLLGGQPQDETCYTHGKVDYDLCLQKPFFREGMAKLMKLFKSGSRIALLCSEKKPDQCHRVKLVGVALAAGGVPVVHIDDTGRLQTQAQVMEALSEVRGQIDLFGSPSGRFSRKKYHNGR